MRLYVWICGTRSVCMLYILHVCMSGSQIGAHGACGAPVEFMRAHMLSDGTEAE